VSVKTFFLLIISVLGFGHNILAAPKQQQERPISDSGPMKFDNTEAYDNLSISEVPNVEKLPPPEKPYYFSYKRSAGFFVGPAYLIDAEEDRVAFGLTYSYYLKDFSAWDYSFNIMDGDGRLEAGKKWVNTFTKRFRYHYGALLGMTFDADKGLANFVNFQKILVGGLAGYEWNLRDRPFSFRNDLKVFIGKDESYYQINFYAIYNF
tara:strand:+ start:1274 stop:1894 length:621 start_codon:yes stop_codon:yes gene_type:complete